MIIVGTALRAREAEGRPIRVGMVGAGFMARGLTNQIVNSVPGMDRATGAPFGPVCSYRTGSSPLSRE